MPAKRRLLCKRNRGPHTAGNAWTFCPLLFCMQRSGSVGCRCTTISRQELQVAALRDAFMKGASGRARARKRPTARKRSTPPRRSEMAQSGSGKSSFPRSTGAMPSFSPCISPSSSISIWIHGRPTMRTPISGCPSWARANAPSVQILGQRPRGKKCLAVQARCAGAGSRHARSLRARCDPDAAPGRRPGVRRDGEVISPSSPVPQGCRPVSRSIETKANAASASEKYTVLVTTSVTT